MDHPTAIKEGLTDKSIGEEGLHHKCEPAKTAPDKKMRCG